MMASATSIARDVAIVNISAGDETEIRFNAWESWSAAAHQRQETVICDRRCSSRLLGECRGSSPPRSSLKADRSVSSEIVVAIPCSWNVHKRHISVQLLISVYDSDSIPGRGNNFSHHIPCRPQRIVSSWYRGCSRRSIKYTDDFHRMPRIWMCGAFPPFRHTF